MSLKGKRIVMTGGSRGIGEAIALRCAREGASIAILAKTDAPHALLPGTIHTAAEKIIQAGGKALPLCVDIRDETQVRNAVQKVVEQFGGIDILVNNASAIQLTSTLETEMKRFDLMFAVNVRGTFMCSKICLPHLMQGNNPHILNLSPPLNMEAKWFAPHVAYTMSKYGMSLCVLGMAEEFKGQGIAVNGLWPKTVIATAAIYKLGGESMMQMCRSPDIVADAAYAILTKPSGSCTGNYFIDEELLRAEGVTDFVRYSIDPHAELLKDYFIY